VEKPEKFGISLEFSIIERSRCEIKFGNNYSEEFKATVGLKLGENLDQMKTIRRNRQMTDKNREGCVEQ